ncbi:MAG: hypothetical protein QM652_02160 [Legionella sp.]|uniref:hypothetical protein n=1 Tax=Legionella sp. TaxID=459 RepID=UPI0039E2E13E
MKLSELIVNIENNKNLGIFSKSHKTISNSHTYNIPFELKPSQQVLAALGACKDSHQTPLLTAKGTIKSVGNADIMINSFMPKKKSSDLTIRGKRIDNLFASSKIYLNPDLMSTEDYKKIITEKPMIHTDQTAKDNDRTSYENLAVGICHAQEIDLLVDTCLSEHKRSHVTVKPERSLISEDTPTILLLSNPRLDLSKEHTKALKNKEQIKYITSMYRNLFSATIKEGRKYIVMPAVGLSKHNGSAQMYFNTLMTVAQEYPQLNIIYNTGANESIFEKAFQLAGYPANVAQTTKDIIDVVLYLQSEKLYCALHLPASSDVVYGLKDVGAHWQIDSKLKVNGTHPSHSLEAFIGTISTAPLGSYGINSEAYDRIIEINLNNTVIKKPDQVPQDVPLSDNISVAPMEQNTIETPSGSHTETKDETAPKYVFEQAFLSSSTAPSLQAPGANGFFPPASEAKKVDASNTQHLDSSLNPDQLKRINGMIHQLELEMKSYWPIHMYNRALKQHKIYALNALMTNAKSMPVVEAVELTKKKFPRATQGRWISKRTADLFHDLENSSSGLQC